MNITIIYHNGLAENSKAFYREFSRQGIKVSVIVPKKVKVEPVFAKDGLLSVSERDFESSFRLIPVDLINISRYNLGFHPLQLHKALKVAKPDIIQVLNEYTGIHVTQAIFSRNILFGRKTPVVAYAFENIRFKPLSFISKAFYSFILAYNRKYIDGVTGASTEAIENVKAFSSKIHTKLIFWGIDFNNFYPKDQNSSRKKIGLPENINLIGYFGRIIKEKGLEKLCQAVSKIPDCHLMLIGDGAYKDQLNRMIDSLQIKSRVHWYSCMSAGELVNYYNCLDVFVLPSQTTSVWKEQYGRVLVEAMACNIPIIGSTSGAIPEVLNGYPKHLIFKEDSVIGLINKIKKIAELKSLEKSDLNIFLNKFSIGNFVSKHIEFYEILLGDRK